MALPNVALLPIPMVAVAADDVVLATTRLVMRFTELTAGVKPVKVVVPLKVQDVVADVVEGITYAVFPYIEVRFRMLGFANFFLHYATAYSP